MTDLPDSWQDGVEKLAALAVLVRSNLLTPAEKRALDVPGVMSAIGDNKALSHALIGAGAGAGLSGLRTAYSNRSRDPESRRSVLSSMLTGGIAGAGLGGGVGLAREAYGAKTPSTSAAAGDSASAMPHGQYIDPTSGKRMQLDTAAIKANPGLASELRQLRTPSLPTTIAGGVAGAWQHLRENAPNATTLLPLIGAGDLAAHGPWRRHNAGSVGGTYGRQFLANAVKAEDFGNGVAGKAMAGNLPNGVTTDGITATVPGHPNATQKPTLSRRVIDGVNYLRHGLHRNSGVQDILGTMTSRPGSDDALTATGIKTSPAEITQGDKKIKEDVPRGTTTAKINKGQVAQAKLRGGGPDPFGGRSVYRVPMTSRYYHGIGALPRVGLYGAALGGDYLAHALRDDSNNQKKIHDLIAQYAKEVK